MISERKQLIDNTSSITEYLGNWLWNALDLENTELNAGEMLKFLGELCKCERAYVFEIDYSNETISNTYEWCAKGITPQIEMLQNESIQIVDFWLDLFRQNKNVIIPDVEAIKTDAPSTYAVLKPQDVKSLVAVPIYLGNDVVGFLGVDNPEKIDEDEIIPVLKKISSLFSFIVKHRNAEKKITFDKYHDPLTLAYNREAFEEDFKKLDGCRQLGIVSCDLSELETTNDESGYQEGNILLCRLNALLGEVFAGYKIYRVTGNRFLVVCPNIDSAYFDKLIKNLEGEINNKHIPLVFGSYWSNENPLVPVEVRAVAESVLYKNKAIYFSKPDPVTGRTRDRRMMSLDNFVDHFNDSRNSMLYRFIENNYFSLDVFFKALELGDSHPYFGDLQKNAWFISDTIKEKWGFENNIVHDLPEEWKQFITHEKDREFYEKDFSEFIKQKRDVYDLIYRVVDKYGEEVWVRCAGYIKWDKEREKPLFYSGNVSILSNAFETCPITNFQKEKAAVRAKYALPARFVLNVGAIEPRKNALEIVKAIAPLSDLSLVLVGAQTAYYQQIVAYCKTHNLSHRVLALKGVSMQELAMIYQQAEVFCYPSVFEGFGIPIIEALFSRVPVITSEGSCFAEAGGAHSCYIQLDKAADEIREAIVRISSDRVLREEMIEKGYAHAQHFTDEAVYQQLMAVYKQVAH